MMIGSCFCSSTVIFWGFLIFIDGFKLNWATEIRQMSVNSPTIFKLFEMKAVIPAYVGKKG